MGQDEAMSLAHRVPPAHQGGVGPVRAERIRAASCEAASLRHWGGLSAWEAADLVRRDVIGGQLTLPPVWLLEGIVAPVITWHEAALARRTHRAEHPILSRARWGQLFREGRAEQVPAVLDVVAFVAVQPLPQARRVMAWLAGYAAVAVAIPCSAGPDPWEAFECDYRGFTVAEVSPEGACAVVPGRGSGRGRHLPEDAHSRLLQEQLFDVALRSAVADPVHEATS